MASARARWILLNLIPGVGSLQWRRLLEAFETLERLWTASVHELQQVEGVTPAMAQRIVEGRQAHARLERELELADRFSVRMVTREDAGFPATLRAIPDPPLALYVRGTLTDADATAVAVVGARQASAYGLACAERLGYELALRGVTVVSGLARGIDGAAHQGALRGQGRTLAVLGGGLTSVYPPEHARLAEQIMERGALISEYPLEAPPNAFHFPRRNRLISGLSLGVVVVEAAQRSGALITADCALEQGREVFAVPGPMTAVTSQGTHALLKEGARLVTSVEDILEELRLIPPPPARTVGSASAASRRISPSGRAGGGGTGVQLPDPERRVFACLRQRAPAHIDAIAEQSGLPIPEVSSLLLQLELKRLVRQLPGKQFVRQ